MSDTVEIFTDGACKGNPGPGGWGALLRCKGVEKTISGGSRRTTNNKMELSAAIQALELLKKPCKVKITTDSQYVMYGITEWIHKWKKNGWKTVSKKPVKNVELWQRLDKLLSQHDVEWEWVRGHVGHPENEVADHLARKAIEQYL